jgi:hypothetical protein
MPYPAHCAIATGTSIPFLTGRLSDKYHVGPITVKRRVSSRLYSKKALLSPSALYHVQANLYRRLSWYLVNYNRDMHVCPEGVKVSDANWRFGHRNLTFPASLCGDFLMIAKLVLRGIGAS